MPGSDLTRLLNSLRRAGRTGEGLTGFSASAIAPRVGADSLTLTLVSARGALELLWADPDDPIGPPLEDLQYTLGEGPTVDAAHGAAPVTVTDLHDTPRWPALIEAVPRTTAARAVAAVPLRLGVIAPAVLTAYRTAPDPFTPDCLATLTVLAQTLLRPLLDTPAERLRLPTPGAYDLLRAEVHQAAGMTSVHLHVPIDQALLRLRAHAWTHDQLLRDVAHAVVTKGLRLNAE
ncbi:ANTAR domain-containing protein [Streptomyces sp. NPDC059785]|uniref:ANTAR domain-containing protein n=1 Tax=unclassified Streptomyces TaxID=2593676 RepID=UPI003654DD32